MEKYREVQLKLRAFWWIQIMNKNAVEASIYIYKHNLNEITKKIKKKKTAGKTESQLGISHHQMKPLVLGLGYI